MGMNWSPAFGKDCQLQRVIMATGYVDEYKVFGQPGTHVDALLLKPFTFQELKDAIEQVMALEPPDESAALPPLMERPPEDEVRPPLQTQVKIRPHSDGN